MAETHLLKRTLSDLVADELRQEIRSGTTPPGTRLLQREVAERFGVSITPVREAFSMLEREGLLVSTPHRGVLVFHPSAGDLSEIYEIRIPLEVHATEIAAAQVTDAELRHLDDLVAAMRAAMDDDERYTRLHRDFHMAIYAAARRRRLEKLIADLRDASSAYLRLYTALLPAAGESQRDHEAILEALKAHDASRAGEAVARHLKQTVETVTQRLRDPARDLTP